jgi:hypothetical protein
MYLLCSETKKGDELRKRSMYGSSATHVQYHDVSQFLSFYVSKDYMSYSWHSRSNCVASWHKNNYTKLIYLSVYLWLCRPFGPWPLFSFFIFYTVGRTPWTGDQPVARQLPAHGTPQSQNKMHMDILAASGIRTHDPTVWASSCLRPRGRCSRLHINCGTQIKRV